MNGTIPQSQAYPAAGDNDDDVRAHLERQFEERQGHQGRKCVDNTASFTVCIYTDGFPSCAPSVSFPFLRASQGRFRFPAVAFGKVILQEAAAPILVDGMVMRQSRVGALAR